MATQVRDQGECPECGCMGPIGAICNCSGERFGSSLGGGYVMPMRSNLPTKAEVEEWLVAQFRASDRTYPELEALYLEQFADRANVAIVYQVRDAVKAQGLVRVQPDVYRGRGGYQVWEIAD